jgi:hypothetical protein
MPTDEADIPEPSSSGYRIGVGTLKRYKSPGIDQFWQNLFKEEVTDFVLRSTNVFSLLGIRKNLHSIGGNL